LRGHFSIYGDIEKIDVIKYKEKNQSRGFAFVYFTDESSFTKAVAETHYIEGKRVNNSIMTKTRLTVKRH
jgi:RNA recognition motif-containing protein